MPKSTLVVSGQLANEGRLTEYDKNGAKAYVYRNSVKMERTGNVERTNRVTGEPELTNAVTFMPFVIWGEKAKGFHAGFTKNDMVHMSGELVPSNVVRKDGTEHQSFEIKVFNVLNENQAKHIRNAAFAVIHPEIVAEQQAAKEAQSKAQEPTANDFGDQDMEM